MPVFFMFFPMFFALKVLTELSAEAVIRKNSQRTVFAMVCLRHDAVVLYTLAQFLDTSRLP